MDGISGVVSLAKLIDLVIQIYIWVLIASAILSWLVAFDVVNRRSPLVSKVGQFLYRVTEPVLRPVRRMVPLIAGVDLSPLVVILLLWLIRNLLFEYVLF
jgi:YggT family protein